MKAQKSARLHIETLYNRKQQPPKASGYSPLRYELARD